MKFFVYGLALFLSVPAVAAEATHPEIVFETNKGDIVVRLFTDKAPLSSKNMLEYVDAGFYDGTIFHRVIKGFMIQGGGFTKDFTKKGTKPPVKNEAANGLKNKRGTLAMARTSEVDSASSQFFINTVDNPRLDHTSPDPQGFGYAVIGEVVKGMDVVDAIQNSATLCPASSYKPCPAAATLPPGMRDVPSEAVIIKHASRKK